MARGQTLGELVTQLRIATRHDSNPSLSQSMEPIFQQTLKDTQERLFDEFDWPFLYVTRDKSLEAGQRYYDLPDDMNLERLSKVDVRFADTWLPVERGINLNCYNIHDSDSDQRSDPVIRWDVVDTGDGEQIEVWPIPVSASRLRFRGTRNLKPLVSQTDRADLDDQLIVLFAAAEILGGAKNDLAKLKLQQANKRLEVLRGRTTTKRNRLARLGLPMEGSHRRYPRNVTIVSSGG